jgi:hypothetical protein
MLTRACYGVKDALQGRSPEVFIVIILTGWHMRCVI